jgi:hypothetical protein
MSIQLTDDSIYQRRRDATLGLAAALLAVLLLALGYSRAWPLALDIGGQDRRFVDLVTPEQPMRGFHAVEPFGGAMARWTSGDATLALPRPPDGAASILALRLLNSRPAGQPAPLLRLNVDGQPIGTFEVPHSESGMRVYHLLAPAGARLDWAMDLNLRTEAVAPPGDPRQLGVVVDGAALAPLGAALPPAWLLLVGAALGVLGYAFPRSIALGRWVALALATVLAALVAWGIAARPLELLPFIQRIDVLLGLGCLGIWVARLLTPTTDDRRPTTDNRSPEQRTENKEQRGSEPRTENRRTSPVTPSPLHPFTPSPLHPFTRSPLVRGADLPIYLAAAWWMGPLFQAFITADGAQGVSPPAPTAWIGGALALGLLGAGVWHWLRRPPLYGGPSVAAPTTDDGGTENREPPEHRTKSKEQKANVPAHPLTPSSLHLFTRAALALLAVAALAHLGYMLWFAFGRQGPDFWILFKGARDWARGGSLYDLQAIQTNHFGHVFKVPPFYGMLFVPFVFQDGERILFFHRLINVLLIGATALVWLRMWGLRLFSAAGAGLLIVLNFRPIADTLAFGQIDLALLLLLVLALWALRSGRDLPAGVLIALGTLFKIYPVILLAFLVAKRSWRALLGFVLGMLLFNALAVAVMGWEMHRVYLTEVLPKIGGTTAQDQNQAISGFMARFAAAPTDAAIFRDRAITLPALAISGMVALLGCVLALGAARPRSTAYALQYSQFLLLMVLVVPAAWMHYEALLVVPFGVLLLHLRDRAVPLPQAAALALSFALIGYGNQLSFYTGTVMGILTVAGASYKFYGMLLLGGVLVAELLAEHAPLELPGWLPMVSGWRQVLMNDER